VDLFNLKQVDADGHDQQSSSPVYGAFLHLDPLRKKEHLCQEESLSRQKEKILIIILPEA